MILVLSTRARSRLVAVRELFKQYEYEINALKDKINTLKDKGYLTDAEDEIFWRWYAAQVDKKNRS